MFDDKIDFYFLNLFLQQLISSLQNFFYILCRRYLIIFKNQFWKRIHPESRNFERRTCAQTQDLQIFEKFYMAQMNPKEAFHNTAYSVQLPYIAGHCL